jgi:hypothetical protein
VRRGLVGDLLSEGEVLDRGHARGDLLWGGGRWWRHVDWPPFPLGALLSGGADSIAAFKNHLSYLPHSGSVFPELAGYETSSGGLRFPVDEPLPAVLVRKLIAVRLGQT